MSSPSARRAIPRPWLSEEASNGRGVEPHPQVQVRSYAPIFDDDPNVDVVWEKPNWSISWGKLGSCFCIRPQPERERERERDQRQSPSKALNQPKVLDDVGIYNNNASFYLQSKYLMSVGDRSGLGPPPFGGYPGHFANTNSMRSCSIGSRGAAWIPNSDSMSSFSLSDSASTMSESSSSFSGQPSRQPRHQHTRTSSSFVLDPSNSHDLFGSALLPAADAVDRPPPAPASQHSPHQYSSHNLSPMDSTNSVSNTVYNNSNTTVGRPPMISQRNTSLPPRMTNTSPPRPVKSSNPPSVRGRCDTGDFSKSSALTNGSRHRRMNQHFSFCDDSIEEILTKQDPHQRRNSFCFNDDLSSTGVPLSMILCPDSSRPTPLGQLDRDSSGYISPMEDEYDEDFNDDDSSLNMSGFDFDINNADIDEERMFTAEDLRKDDDSSSPFANLSRKVPSDGWMQDWADSGPITKPPTKINAISVKRGASAHLVTPRADEVEPSSASCRVEPDLIDDKSDSGDYVYLRKNQEIDMMFGNRLAISGWVAVTFGEESMAARVGKKCKLSPNDLYYVSVTEEADSSVAIFFSDEHGNVLHTLQCDSGWRCESREISSRIGRCVHLRNGKGEMLASLLPISLSDCFLSPSSGALLPEEKFAPMSPRLFGAGPYAPDEQHDATMHMLFTLDALFNKIHRRFY